jgi:guanine deaminase
MKEDEGIHAWCPRQEQQHRASHRQKIDMSAEPEKAPSAPAQSADNKLQWIFRGNLVVPLHNPFLEDSLLGEQERDSRTFRQLGPGLELWMDHVLAVDSVGFIVHLAPASLASSQELLRQTQVPDKTFTFIKLCPQTEFLCPGFIDLHIHAPQFIYTGTATDRPLMGPGGWLEAYAFPAESSLKNNSDKCRSVYDQVVSTTLQCGTTTAMYFATLDVEPCQVLVDVCLQYKQRAVIGKNSMDRNAPSNYCHSTSQNLQESVSLIRYIHRAAGQELSPTDSGFKTSPLPLVLPSVAPRFIPTCTPELLRGLGDIAAQYSCHITSHISESLDEVQYSGELEGGRSDAQVLATHGLLTDRSIMAHAIYLSKADMDLMHQHGSAIAHCPLSNFFFGGGVAPVREYLSGDNRIKVGLGTDVAGGYHPSILHCSRMAVIASHSLQQQLHSLQGGSKDDTGASKQATLDFRHAFYLATLGGAEALGLDHRIGTFRVGMEFDALILSAGPSTSDSLGHDTPPGVGLVKPTISRPLRSMVQCFETDSTEDLLQKILVLGDDRNIAHVFVQGHLVK